jgi:hypothetical protein
MVRRGIKYNALLFIGWLEEKKSKGKETVVS